MAASSGSRPRALANIPLLPATASSGSTLTLAASVAPLAAWAPPSPEAQSGPPPPPPPQFHLASSLPLIPGKLVRKIQALEFVEMRDLFPDNIALAERLEALPSHRTPSSAPETREVGALATWVTAFATYIAIVAVAHPGRVRYMLAYMRLLVREAQKFWGHWVDHLRPSISVEQARARGETGPARPLSAHCLHCIPGRCTNHPMRHLQ